MYNNYANPWLGTQSSIKQLGKHLTKTNVVVKPDDQLEAPNLLESSSGANEETCRHESQQV